VPLNRLKALVAALRVVVVLPEELPAALPSNAPRALCFAPVVTVLPLVPELLSTAPDVLDELVEPSVPLRASSKLLVLSLDESVVLLVVAGVELVVEDPSRPSASTDTADAIRPAASKPFKSCVHLRCLP